MTTCTGPGPDGTRCGRHAKYKGLCDTHRTQLRRGRPLTVPRPIREKCTVDGCERDHLARGYCSGHYKQWRADSLGKTRTYSTEAKPCPGPGADGKPCGRDVVGRGYCAAHCRQARLGQPLQPLRLVGQAVVKANGGVVRNGSTRGRTAPRSKQTPKPKPASNLPDGWHKPTVRPRPKPSTETALERVDTLLRVPVLDPHTIQTARSKLIRWGAADLLDMLGLDAA